VKHRERKRQNQRIGSNSTRKGTAKNTKRKRGTKEERQRKKRTNQLNNTNRNDIREDN